MSGSAKAAIYLSGARVRIERVLGAIRRQADQRKQSSFEWLHESLRTPVWDGEGCWLEISHPSAAQITQKLAVVANTHGVRAECFDGGRPSPGAEALRFPDEEVILTIARELKVNPKRFPNDVILRAKELMDYVLSGAPLRDLDGKWLHKDKSVLSLKLGRSYRMIFRRQRDGSLQYESVMSHETYNKAIC
jgi:hypothetical protein